ncbi:helix-turn-helix domain-containing protein [Fontivita pretiosa]|uniref:helix-turn-helix domain-containing protein n=1 Tax=Fontivita pretiosa TaxID=2989684 RepID=UPI003D18049B
MNDQADDNLTPREAARYLGHSRRFVIDLIRAGELVARDERRPGSKLARFRIRLADLEAWKASRRVPHVTEADRMLASMPRLVGVLRARRDARQARQQREAARHQIAAKT